MPIAVPGRWGVLALSLLAGLLMMAAPGAQEQRSAAPPPPERGPPPQAKTPEETAYFLRLKEYRRARATFEKEADAYWDLITDKRQLRRKRRAEGHNIGLDHYVLDQPPVYRGPSEPAIPKSLIKPRPPSAQPAAPAAPPLPPIPVVADFLEQAKTHFSFTPERAASEAEFKRAYAQAAMKAGISKDQAVRIYGFEASGNGRHDVQAGLEASGAKRRAISTALGYNQLLVTNTISMLAAHDDALLAALAQRSRDLGQERRARLEAKLAGLKRMIAFAKSVPQKWSVQDDLARTPKGWAVHALNLDIDIGPLLQAQKLADSLAFAQRKGYGARLTAAELEMMNLMGDGSGYDVISMPEEMRPKVPTANMFQRGGYDRNTVVRKNNTVASLLSATDAKMDSQAELPGARELEAAFNAVAASAASVPVR